MWRSGIARRKGRKPLSRTSEPAAQARFWPCLRCEFGESASPVHLLGSGTMSDHVQTEPFEAFPAEPFNAPSAIDIIHRPALPPWLAGHLLRANEEITWVRG